MEENQVWVEIGHRLSQTRKGKKIKQISAADVLGLKQSNLSDVERGKVKLSVEVLLKACKLYNTSSDKILFNREVIETNEHLDELINLAKRYDDILYKLDMLEDPKDVEEIRQHLNGLLMP